MPASLLDGREWAAKKPLRSGCEAADSAGVFVMGVAARRSRAARSRNKMSSDIRMPGVPLARRAPDMMGGGLCKSTGHRRSETIEVCAQSSFAWVQ